MERLVPKQVDIEVTNRCNLKCKYCPGVCNDSFPQGDMDLEFFKSIIDRINWPCTVVAWLNGEPMMHPQYLDMMKYLNQKHQRFYVTTNLTIWREDVLFELLKSTSSCYQLIVSMDGLFGSGNIAKARPGTDERVLEQNLNKLLRMKRDMDSHVDLAFKICERGQDWGEIENYVQYWLEEDGVDFVVVGKPLKDENEQCMRTEPCQYSDHNFMVIRWNGSLVTCAYNDKAANHLMNSYGRLNATDNLIDVFNNPAITQFREDQRNGKYPKPCDTCGFAYTGLGYQGKVAFRANPEIEYYFHQDYYNSFFSKKQNWKPVEYYRNGR